MRALVVVALLAACGSKGGLELVVTPPAMAIDKVAVFVGIGDEHADPVAPDGFRTPIADSSWWNRDAMNELDVVTDVAGKTSIVFAYERGSGDTTLGVVIAVGYAGDKPVAAALLEHVDVPDGYVARYPLALQPIVDPRTGTPANGLALELWSPLPGSTDPDGTCAYISDPSTTSRHMVVSSDDRDCDGYKDDDPMECDAHVYGARLGPGIDRIRCLQHEVLQTPGGTTATACVLGGDLCKDGAGWTTGCVSSGICVPNSDCTGCTTAAFPDEVARFKCVSDITAATPDTMARVACSIRVDAQGHPCTTPLQMFPTRPLANRTCTGPVKIAHAGGPFDTHVTIGTMQFELGPIGASCDFTVTPSGTWPTGETSLAAIVASPLDNGRGAAIPVVFSLDSSTPGCATTPTVPCTLLSLDLGYSQCVDAMPIPP